MASSLPNVTDEPRAAAHKRLSSSENAASSGLGPWKIAAPVSALALATGWPLLGVRTRTVAKTELRSRQSRTLLLLAKVDCASKFFLAGASLALGCFDYCARLLALFLPATFKMSHGRSGPLALAAGWPLLGERTRTVAKTQ